MDNETRYGIDWIVDLGPGEVRLLQEVFRDLFHHVEEFKDLEAARGRTSLKALFEARVDQYSFVTARETGGRYYAVTIRYRINLYTPEGDKVDSYTLTGYGNSLASGMSGGRPLTRATAGAMRDAAAKFLVQFPEQPAGLQLARNEPVLAEKPAASAATPGSPQAQPDARRSGDTRQSLREAARQAPRAMISRRQPAALSTGARCRSASPSAIRVRDHSDVPGHHTRGRMDTH